MRSSLSWTICRTLWCAGILWARVWSKQVQLEHTIALVSRGDNTIIPFISLDRAAVQFASYVLDWQT